MKTGLPVKTGSLFATLRERCEQQPERVCLYLLRAGQPDQALTYGALGRLAAGYAAQYARAGIQPGEVVVLILEHGLDLAGAFWGAVLHGALPSIMPFLTEKLQPERYRQDLAALFEVTQPGAVVTYPAFAEEVRQAAAGTPRAVVLSSDVSQAEDVDFDGLLGRERRPQDLALLQHSSGTTGLQKGVALSHQAIFNQLANYRQAIELNEADVIVSWLPLYHDMGLIAGFLMPILEGVPLVLMSPFDWVRAPYRLMQAVTKYRGTLTWLPNFAYHFCAQKTRDAQLAGVDLSSWRAVINCSEPTYWSSHQKFIERFAPYGLKAEALATCYAMAENVFAVTQSGVHEAARVEQVDAEKLQREGTAVPVSSAAQGLWMLSAGKPVANTAVKVMDAEGRERSERQVGEIAVRSNCMLTGYYHRPDLTAQVLRDGWYLTGDLGYLAEGDLFVTGRKKDLMIVGGKNIYPQDLEYLASEISGVHPGRVVVFGVFDEAQGTEEAALVAEVDTADEQERLRIEDDLRAAITRGSAVALRNIHLVGSGWIIKTSSGKTARAANREKYLKERTDA